MMQRAATDNMYQSPEKALFSAGLCLRRMGRTAEAEESLRRAVLIRPDMIGALFNLAVLTYERGAYKDAETYLLRYMRMSQPSFEALVLGVKIARKNGDRVAADSFMQQLRRRYPDAPQLRELEDQK
jgi:type IV pilus assembly protein PilF